VGHGDWRGGAHLAQSFDTMGCLFRDLSDAPLLAGLFVEERAGTPREFGRFAVVGDSFFHDCEPEILAGLRTTALALEALGMEGTRMDAGWWADSFEIFSPIQAWEAARIHAGHFDHFAPAIRERLQWGAGIGDGEIAALRQRHAAFRDRMDQLFATHELILLPASPVARLEAGADHSKTRARLLRYTTPFSLAGVPAVTVPGAVGGVQIAAARGSDKALLRLTGRIGDHVAVRA
jgi:aspartyl-tRNA(Asn)/glutamyl-tRNA(Gln) amidotransferase subunit A